ncbi:hypothetical protein [Aneurinibacillus sp. REN35]|uniref:hypothetical protein n=1 Tax=Aneurinibacillus sp. REN35 TaxID=3237286 RepID=UPI00352926CE
MSSFLHKQLRTQLHSEIPRLSFYRMLKSTEFDELCRFYQQDMITLAQFKLYTQRLERLF